MARRLPKGIHRTATGYRTMLMVSGIPYTKRWKRDASIDEMKAWLIATRAVVSSGPHTPAASGTFAADARRYLEAVKAMPTYSERKRHIDEWVAAFGPERRKLITSDQIAAQLATWKNAGKAASSVNHRRTALMHLYCVLDGKSARNPVRDVPKFTEPSPLPRDVADDLLDKLWEAMPDGEEKARAQVLTFTGIPHKQIGQIQESDVDFDRGTVLVQGRKKGKGTAARRVPISPAALAAFEMMRRFKAWGHVDRWSLRRAIHAACDAAGIPRIRPYDLRHTFGTRVYQSSGDIRAAQVLMGHSTPILTHRYTLAAVDPRLEAVVAALGGKNGGKNSAQNRAEPKKSVRRKSARKPKKTGAPGRI